MANLTSGGQATQTLLAGKTASGATTDRPRATVVVTNTQFTEQKTFTDWPLRTLNKSVSGTVYGPDRIISPGARVKLFRQADDELVATQIATQQATYVFLRDKDDPYAYYVVAYSEDSTPQIHGVSDRGSLPK